MSTIRKELTREKNKVNTFFNKLVRRKEELKDKEIVVAL